MIITGLRNNCGKRWPSSKQKLEDQRPALSVFWSTAASCKLDRESRQLPGETEEKLTSTESCCSLVCCEPGALRLRSTGKQEEELQPELRECRWPGPLLSVTTPNHGNLQTVRQLFALCLPSLMSFFYWILNLKMGFWERYFQSYLTYR